MLELHQVKCKQALTRTLKAQQNTDLLHVYYYIKKTPQLYREVLADCILSSLSVFLIVISLYPTLMPQEIFFSELVFFLLSTFYFLLIKENALSLFFSVIFSHEVQLEVLLKVL